MHAVKVKVDQQTTRTCSSWAQYVTEIVVNPKIGRFRQIQGYHRVALALSYTPAVSDLKKTTCSQRYSSFSEPPLN